MIQNAFPALVEPVYCNESADSQFTVNALSFHEMHCKMLLLVLNFRFYVQQDVEMDLESVSTHAPIHPLCQARRAGPLTGPCSPTGEGDIVPVY